MLFTREYGHSGPLVLVLHGGPGAAGYMASAARGLSDAFRVVEPFQRRSGDGLLTVGRHVADLHDVIHVYTSGLRPAHSPALLGSSWGAMLALAYAAAYPASAGPLVLVGCGTFDLAARAEYERIVTERMTDAIRARLKDTDRLDADARLKAQAAATAAIYSYDVPVFPHEEDDVDARANAQTWNDMLRLQQEGIYPAAFAAIRTPVLMVHGTFDPHPGRLIEQSLRPHLPQLDYREFENCGHYPWLEKQAADGFFSLVRDWLGRHMHAS